jgi:hypothetical protein
MLSVTDAALLSERRGWPGSEPGEKRRAQTHHYSVNGNSLLVLLDLDYCCYNKLRRQHANSCLANRPVALVSSYLLSLSCGSEQHIDPASQLLPSPRPRKAPRLDLSRKHILFLRIRDQGGSYGTARSSQLPPPMARSIRMDIRKRTAPCEYFAPYARTRYLWVHFYATYVFPWIPKCEVTIRPV